VPFYPIPIQAIDQANWIQGGAPGTTDLRATNGRRLLILDCNDRQLFELSGVWFDEANTQWHATAGARFLLDGTERRTEGFASADPSGLAILPGLVRFDEADDDDEDDFGHALRVALRASNGHVFPASHTGGTTAGALPLGARLRLKQSVNGQDPVLRTSDPMARRIFRTLQKYGLIAADHGTDLSVSGTFDQRWDMATLDPAFALLKASDFEVVKLGWVAPPPLSIDDGFALEGNSGTTTMTFTVSVPRAHDAPITFDIATQTYDYTNGATSGVDFVARSLTGQVLPAGQLTKTFTVTVNGDTAIENNEYLYVVLANASAPIEKGRGGGFIRNDDLPRVSIADANAQENAGVIQLTVSLSAPAPYDVFVSTATTGKGTATAGIDYASSYFGQAFIPAGSLSAPLSVQLFDDDTIEPDETLVVQLGFAYDAVIGDGTALGTIVNDDLPRLTMQGKSVDEGDSGTKSLRLVAELSQAVTHPVTFTVRTMGAGTATAGEDYTAYGPTTLTIGPGLTVRGFDVPVHGDTKIEVHENFVVEVTNVVGARTYETPLVAHGVIGADDWPALSVSDASIVEGHIGSRVAVFTVSLSEAAPFGVTYNFSTGGSPGTADYADYDSTFSSAHIPAGQLASTRTVPVFGDTAIEGNETFSVYVSSFSTKQGDVSGVGTIVNDDYPTLRIGDVARTEGNTGIRQAVFVVSLSQAVNYPVTFSARTSGSGTATAGVDYVALAPTTFTLPAGLTAKTFAINLKGDTAVEANETYVVSISNVVGATVADGAALGTITNDD
jgi:hypothetical protein